MPGESSNCRAPGAGSAGGWRWALGRQRRWSGGAPGAGLDCGVTSQWSGGERDSVGRGDGPAPSSPPMGACVAVKTLLGVRGRGRRACVSCASAVGRTLWCASDQCARRQVITTRNRVRHRQPCGTGPERTRPETVSAVSLGSTALFEYKPSWRKKSPHHSLHLRSGDVLIFGGRSRAIVHGVSGLLPHSIPDGVDMDIGPQGTGRTSAPSAEGAVVQPTVRCCRININFRRR